jgi:mannose-1-phosphate guanylyltransferase
MFIFRADVLLQAYAAHLPRLHRGLMEILAARRRNRPALITKLFSQIESVSIDYGVMEKASRLVMLPCGCQWNDVGSFASLHEVLPADPNGNIVDGDVLVLDSQGCVLRAESRLLACVGLKGLVVVETPDVVLVCPKEEAQRVGRLVEELRRRKRRDVL